MQPHTYLIDGLYILALMGLSLGIPEQCAFRYDLENLICQEPPDQHKRPSWKPGYNNNSTTMADGYTQCYTTSLAMGFFETNWIHAPPPCDPKAA